MKKLYCGFDLCSPTTSVSMTINGPAPIILAFYMNAAIDQQCEKYIRAQGLEAEVEPFFTTVPDRGTMVFGKLRRDESATRSIDIRVADGRRVALAIESSEVAPFTPSMTGEPNPLGATAEVNGLPPIATPSIVMLISSVPGALGV